MVTIISFIIAFSVVLVVLFSAVRLHMSFGLHRMFAPQCEVVDDEDDTSLHLHDLIFRQYYEYEVE